MIIIKTPEEIKIMAEGGRILAKIIKELEKLVKPGITTNELNKVAESLVFKFKAKCSFKNYQNFPACLCASINEEIVHSLPSERKLKNGDIVSLDLGILYKDFHTDMALTLSVGEIIPEAEKLIKTTKQAFEVGFRKIKPGNAFGDVGNVIQEYVESQGFNVVRELCGHGIGKKIHEEPLVLNYGKKGSGPKIKKGMVFCLEPMVTMGDWKIKKTKDNYGFQTIDNFLSAHFEHTIAVTKDGAKILTML
jgi:methionyl aminopeptidase